MYLHLIGIMSADVRAGSDAFPENEIEGFAVRKAVDRKVAVQSGDLPDIHFLRQGDERSIRKIHRNILETIHQFGGTHNVRLLDREDRNSAGGNPSEERELRLNVKVQKVNGFSQDSHIRNETASELFHEIQCLRMILVMLIEQCHENPGVNEHVS
jgi:hypothetical protein